MSNQQQSKIEQEHGKPGEDPLILPPIIPEYEIFSDSSNAELKRLTNLVFQGCSTVVYAQENQLPLKNRHLLSLAFQGECQAVLALVSNTVQFCKSFSAQDRFDLFKSYESLCQNLETLVKEYLVNNKPIPLGKVPRKFIELNFSLWRLLQRQGIMSSIEGEVFVGAFAKWAKEYQETQKKAEQPTETSNGKVDTLKEPLSKNAEIVYNLLTALPPYKALTAPQILDEVANRYKKYWDEKELYNRIFPQLKPWGLTNKPRVGYRIEKKSADAPS